jgi:predicted membrane chloride channel (bestrophin family)
MRANQVVPRAAVVPCPPPSRKHSVSAGEYGYLALGIEALVAYFLLGIEFTAEDVEEPFGKDGDDLELTRYCEIIRTSLQQIFQEPNTP